MSRIAATVSFALGLGCGSASAAPYLQPGMQTMIQQGGVEGTVLGEIFRPRVVYVPVYVPVARDDRRTTRPRAAMRRPDRSAHRDFRHLTAR